MCYRLLLLACCCCLAVSCRTSIPGPPELPPSPTEGAAAPPTLSGQLICIYCSVPKIRQRSVDSTRWGKWHSGWNISDDPVVFAFPRDNNNRDGHKPSDVIRTDYFTAAYAAKKTKLGSYPDPLAKARKPRGRVKSHFDMPEWSMAPTYQPRAYYPQLNDMRKWNEMTKAEAEVRNAEIKLYQQGLDLGYMFLQTDRAYMHKGNMFITYKAEGGDRAVLYFDYPMENNRYLGWYELQFVTENAGIARQYARCRNREIEVQPMTFRIVPMNFTDEWLTP